MASPVNQHCVSCIGTLVLLPTAVILGGCFGYDFPDLNGYGSERNAECSGH